MRALDALAAQRGQLFPWVPVALSIGIGSYFLLPVEPGAAGWAALAVAAAIAAAAAVALNERLAPLAVFAALALAGLLVAGLRTHLVAAPVLQHRFYGAVEARIVALDRSLSDKPRLTLDRVWLEGVPASETPARVRMSLHGQQGGVALRPGATVMMTGHLSPPAGPAEPGGFSFRRYAWFKKLGAVGYTRSPVLTLSPPETGAALAMTRLRASISSSVRARLPGNEGAFAATILTGDRASIPRETLEDLRDSNLAHLLAISGLHMGLLAGFVFAAMRYGMALVPRIALTWPTKKIAATAALFVAAVYLALSGGNVATQRAFVMVGVMLTAVLFDRRALSLRAVALSATLILIWRPESLTGPGFQMSFAATTALVVVFGLLRDHAPARRKLPRWLAPVVATIVSSLVAGLATAPIAAAHFNQVAQFGFVANLLAVPMMGALVMPAAVLAAVLAPFGLSVVGLKLMGWGISWILGVAGWIAGLDGATWPVITPGPAVLPMLAAGALWLMLWQGRVRFAGAVPCLVAALLWSQTERPALLIAESGGLIGVLQSDGRALSKERGESFIALSWLKSDGDASSRQVAHGRPGFDVRDGMKVASVAGQKVVLVSGRGWADRLPAACELGWVVLARDPGSQAPEGCVFYDPGKLSRTGAIAIYERKSGPLLVTAREVAGARPWGGQ